MRKIAVVFPELDGAQRRRLASAALSRGFAAEFYDGPEGLEAGLGDAEIVLAFGAKYAKMAPRVRWFCSTSAGVETYFAPGVLAPGALLSNSSGAYGVTISEHIIMVSLELLRRQPEYEKIVAARGWTRNLGIRSLHGARITLLGTGDIGRAAAVRLRAFCPASLVGVNRSGRNPEGLFDRVLPVTELDSVLPETDLLIMSLPATGQTRGIMSRRRLELLPPGAYIVNVGRGSAIEEAALEDLLGRGRLGGAALDVFSAEPIPPESSLWTCPGLLITPHVAGNLTLGYTIETVLGLFLEDFENYCAGRPLRRLVGREREY